MSGLIGLPGESGYNLIEVLIALAVLSFAMLGIAALQIQSVRFNHQSYSRSQAVVLANDYVERMYANRPGVNAGNYAPFDSLVDVDCDVPPARTCGSQSNTVAEVCTPAQMATYDRFITTCGYPTAAGRYGGAEDLLPQGAINVICIDEADPASAVGLNPCPAANRHRITVSWTERTTLGDGTTADTPATFVLEMQP